MKSVNPKTLDACMARLTSYAVETRDEARREFCKDLNRFLDGLAEMDAFGTEGQCDPRGDQRQ